MAAYKYVKNKKDSDKSVSFKFKGESYSPGDIIKLNEAEYLKLSSRYVLEPQLKEKKSSERVKASSGAFSSSRSYTFGSGDEDDNTKFDKGGE